MGKSSYFNSSTQRLNLHGSLNLIGIPKKSSNRSGFCFSNETFCFDSAFINGLKMFVSSSVDVFYDILMDFLSWS